MSMREQECKYIVIVLVCVLILQVCHRSSEMSNDPYDSCSEAFTDKGLVYLTVISFHGIITELTLLVFNSAFN